MSILLQHCGLCNNRNVIEQYDLLLFQACICVTLPLLREEVIILNNILPQRWERHTCICFQQMELLLLYGVLIVAPSRMLQQQPSLDLHLKQKVFQKHVCKPCDIMGIDHGRYVIVAIPVPGPVSSQNRALSARLWLLWFWLLWPLWYCHNHLPPVINSYNIPWLPPQPQNII